MTSTAPAPTASRSRRGFVERQDNGSTSTTTSSTSTPLASPLCPWWDGPVTKLEVDAQLARDAVGRPERWIWLYHSPPAGTGLCRAGRREFPDHDLVNWIEQWQPDLVFTGHVHQAPWVEGGAWSARIGRTWVFNAGRQAGPQPSHVIIDTDAATADWVGLPEFGQISLDP